ncbi:MAG: tetratricopeptide repeat protein [Sphingobacteriaceae bacterium]|jgi:signal transduction histidine kinase|nr:tetratricopeptide repeat protein [Sphingobacteriaceae bacterium]
MPVARLFPFLLILFFCNVNGAASAENPVEQPKTIAYYDKLVSRYRYYKPDSAIFFAQKGIALAQKLGDPNGLAAMYNQLGMIDDNLGKYEESTQKYLLAKSIYRRADNRKGVATETIRLGVVQLRKGNYDKAIGFFLEALRISERIKDKPGQLEAYVTLGEGYMGQHKYDTALKYLNIAEKLDSTLPQSTISLNLLNNLGIVYREKGDYPKAIASFQKGIHESDKPQFQGHFITLTNNLATVYARQGLKQKSIALQKAALAKAREIKNYLRELQTLNGLAYTYGKSDPANALIYLNQAYQLAKDNKAYKEQVGILDNIARMYKAQNRFEEAFQAKDQQYALADSFFYDEMSKQIASLQAEYQLSKSKVKIEQLKNINTRQQFKNNIILAATIATGILLLIFAFYYYKTRKLNILLNNANNKLQDENTIKDKLFSVLAHDLRSPLASIINLLALIDDDEFNQAERKILFEKLSATSHASLDTLDSLLKWGETQLKGVRLQPIEFKPREITERNIALLTANAEAKSLRVSNLIPENATVVADPDHYDFIIRNLLSNAIKFTPDEGSITISARSSSETGDVIFAVKDSGVGIAQDRLESIFTIGNVSTKGTNNEKGTSIGLAICKEFVEANGGTITARSESGKGSEFSFSLKGSI